MSEIKKLPPRITNEQAAALCFMHYGITGKASPLEGELDHNFKIETEKKTFILKINRPGTDQQYLDFQEKLLLHLQNKKTAIKFPFLVKTLSGSCSFSFTDTLNNTRNVRLLEWIPGRIWSAVNPQTDNLRYSLGEMAGEITSLLQGFNHPKATREFDWDINQAGWTYPYLNIFSKSEKDCLGFFMKKFEDIQPQYKLFRKSVIHNDVNDNNIIVSQNQANPLVESIIDFGDAVFTQTVNDLAVTIAYAIMDHPDPLQAALPVVSGYHKKFTLQEPELEILYVLVAMRLLISVTKSAINKVKEPENIYLQISDKQAWVLLNKWKQVHPALAHYSFRSVCGFVPVPTENIFSDWIFANSFSVNDLLPTCKYVCIKQPDLSVGSRFLGNFSSYKSGKDFNNKMKELLLSCPDTLFAGGYLETRPVYSTDAFRQEGNNGPEFRTCHLGTDFWLPENTPVHAFFEGEVVDMADNAFDKDYGPTIILKHSISKEVSFFTLYGHLNKESLTLLKKGMKIKKGKKIAGIGNSDENGNWPPHLHFQIILNLLNQETNFPGVCIPSQVSVWSSICPDPAKLLNCRETTEAEKPERLNLVDTRKKILGKSLSLSYTEPLKILRGEMQYLIDESGRRYLDTVNNVAHVGHEHPRVVKAGQGQMAVLNTNTRYLHETIIEYAKEICKTLPEELSVIHFVNSGSEANDLAMRMAEAYTHQKDIIALEAGYHGNTGRCIDISSYKFDGKGGKGKPGGTHIVPLPDSFRGRYRGSYAETGIRYAEHVLEKITEIKKAGRSLSAFIAESIISCGGQIVLPDDYLKTTYRYVRETGAVCIADEVQVGFGRVGKKFWGFELQQVIPDIVTMGKPMGNGHPLAAVACTPEIANAFANGMEYFNTYGGNPVSCAIGWEVLQVLNDEKLQENALITGDYLKSSLKKLQEKYPVIADVRGEGLFLGIEFCEAGKIPDTDKAVYLTNRMKENGILMSTDGPQNNVLKIKPPLCFNRANADELLYNLEKILKENFMNI